MLKTALFALIPAALFAAYPYYTPGAYTPNGDTTFASPSGGSQIATATVPSGATEYELRMTLNIKASSVVRPPCPQCPPWLSLCSLQAPNHAGTE